MILVSFSIASALQDDFLARVKEAIHDGFSNDGIFKEFQPALGIDLGGHNLRAFVVALL
jgi:hypothetical protein